MDQERKADLPTPLPERTLKRFFLTRSLEASHCHGSTPFFSSGSHFSGTPRASTAKSAGPPSRQRRIWARAAAYLSSVGAVAAILDHPLWPWPLDSREHRDKAVLAHARRD